MQIKILKVQKSKHPIWETMLSINGPIASSVPINEQSYEMRLDAYEDETNSIPIKSVIVGKQLYSINIEKYGMEKTESNL